jgi:PTS system mannose-specific IIA component
MAKTAILIATHGGFGRAMLQACEQMLGPQERCAALSLDGGMGREDLALQMAAKLREFGGCLVLVDMLGGTPWNAALLYGLADGDEVLAGLSMPLLLEALTNRDSLAPRPLAALLMAKAPEAVASASRLLGIPPE